MGLSPNEQKRYRESKRRRRQALAAEQTGVIKPFKRSFKAPLIILCSIAAAALLACAAVYFIWGKAPADKDRGAAENTADASLLLRVVNRQNPLDSGFVPQLADFDGFKVSALMVSDLTDFASTARGQGIELKLTSAYISYDEQQRLYENILSQFENDPSYTKVRAEAAAQRLVPQAGASEAQTGLLAAFDLSDVHTSAFVERQCVDYGFVLRYPEGKEDYTHMAADKTLYRYVGRETALKLRSYDMCLEEYIDFISYSE